MIPIPFHDKVVVLRDDLDAKTKGGIHIPESKLALDKKALNRGTVVAVGPGKILDDGLRRRMTVEKGDRVWFDAYAGNALKVDEVEYLIFSEESIIAKVDSSVTKDEIIKSMRKAHAVSEPPKAGE